MHSVIFLRVVVDFYEQKNGRDWQETSSFTNFRNYYLFHKNISNQPTLL